MEIKHYHCRNVYKAYKEYIYYYDIINDKIYVTFSDGSFFYNLAINVNENMTRACGEHICNRDYYKAAYSFFNDRYFSLHYQIIGPHKDYRIETDFISFRKYV